MQILGAKRKGSLPTLDLRPPQVVGAPPDMRFRSSSLPLNSLDPLSQRTTSAHPGAAIKVSATPVADLAKEDTPPPPPPQARPFNPRAATATPQEELLSVYNDDHEAGQALIQPESPPATATSNARASSILSISQDTAKQRLDMLAKMLSQKHSLPVAPSSTPTEVEGRNLYRGSLAYSSSSRSEAHSVPHDAVAVPSTPSVAPHAQLGVPPATGNTEKSFDLGSVPFTMTKAQHPPMTSASHGQQNPAMEPSSQVGRRSKEVVRRSSFKRSRRSAARRTAPTGQVIEAARSNEVDQAEQTAVPHLASMSRRPSASILHLLEPEPQPRAFPWKTVKICEAKKTCTPQQLQKLVLDSMREYSSSSSNQPGLLLEGFESIPLELEQCEQKMSEVERMLTTELVGREALLVRHVACLKGFNGEQGARFGESLVSAISRSDRLAQEARMLREHVGKVERLREGHWRAVSLFTILYRDTN